MEENKTIAVAEELLTQIYYVLSQEQIPDVQTRLSQMPDGVFPYKIFGDPDETKYALDKENVSYFSTQDPSIILINRSSHSLTKCRNVDINQKETQKYYRQDAELSNMAQSVSRNKSINNNKLVRINGLTPLEKKNFMKKLNNITPGLLVGTSNKRGDSSLVLMDAQLENFRITQKVAAALSETIATAPVVDSVQDTMSKEAAVALYRKKVGISHAINQVSSEVLDNIGQSLDFKQFLETEKELVKGKYAKLFEEKGMDLNQFSERLSHVDVTRVDAHDLLKQIEESKPRVEDKDTPINKHTEEQEIE